MECLGGPTSSGKGFWKLLRPVMANNNLMKKDHGWTFFGLVPDLVSSLIVVVVVVLVVVAADVDVVVVAADVDVVVVVVLVVVVVVVVVGVGGGGGGWKDNLWSSVRSSRLVGSTWI